MIYSTVNTTFHFSQTHRLQINFSNEISCLRCIVNKNTKAEELFWKMLISDCSHYPLRILYPPGGLNAVSTRWHSRDKTFPSIWLMFSDFRQIFSVYLQNLLPFAWWSSWSASQIKTPHCRFKIFTNLENPEEWDWKAFCTVRGFKIQTSSSNKSGSFVNK